MGEEYMDQLLVLLNQLNIAADEILSMENQSAEEQILEDQKFRRLKDQKIRRVIS